MAAKRTRARYSKSTGGCNTCKIRRIKCDETRPQCRRCVTTGRVCDGPRSSQMIMFQHEQPWQTRSNSPSLSPEIDPQPWLAHPGEKRAFSFFLNQSVPILSGALDSNLWSIIVPRIASSNVVVRYAICAMSHFWEHPVRTFKDGLVCIHPLTQRHLSALSWYSRALSVNRTQNSSAATTEVMLKCVLFSALELQQNNFWAGLRLLRVVYTMLAPFMTAGFPDSKSLPSNDIVNVLVPMAMRSSSLVFTSWDDLSIHLATDSCLDDVQTAVYRALCMVYAGLKDIYLARRANAQAYIDRLLLKQTQIKYNLRMLKGRLAAVDAFVDDVSVRRIQALVDYCEIGLTWLDSLSNTAHLRQGASEFLTYLLQLTKTLDAQAHVLYPAAASSTFFHEVVILPSAYLVAVFAADAEFRADALALMKWKIGHTPNVQLHAMVMSLEGGNMNSTEPPFTNMFQVYHKETDQPQILQKVYEIPVKQPASIWQPSKQVFTEPIQTVAFWTN